MLQEIKKDLHKWKTSEGHELRYSILLRCQYHPVWSTASMQSLSKSQGFFCKNGKAAP